MSFKIHTKKTKYGFANHLHIAKSIMLERAYLILHDNYTSNLKHDII